MEYHFKRQEAQGERVVFALILDRKASKERILIGTETKIMKRLWNDSDSEVYYDETRSLGSIFINYKKEISDGWIDRGLAPLWNALHTNRWKQPGFEKASAQFCTEIYHSGDPLSIYVAIRLWEGYLRAREPRDRDTAAEAYKADLMRLMLPLSDYSLEKLRDRSCVNLIRQSGTEMKLNIWYPSRTNVECITAHGSFLPVFLYYHTRLIEWNLHFRSCKVCSKVFLANSLKYTICSDKCRKKQGTQAKRDFDARAIENEYDHIYKNECQRWLHYIHRMEKNTECSPERIGEIKSAYEEFKKEAKLRKKSVKSGFSSISDFRNWILKQLEKIL